MGRFGRFYHIPREHSNSLERVSEQIDSAQYCSIFEAPPSDYRLAPSWLPANAVDVGAVGWVLSAEALGPPHGLELLSVAAGPTLPEIPGPLDWASLKQKTLEAPPGSGWTQRGARLEELRSEYQAFEKYRASLIEGLQTKRRTIEEKIRRDEEASQELVLKCKQGHADALERLIQTSLIRHPLPRGLNFASAFSLDRTAHVGLCTIEIPDFATTRICKQGGSWKARDVSATEKRKKSQTLVRSLCVRAAYLTAMSAPDQLFETVAVNARQHWFDPATGEPRQGVVASLMAPTEVLRRLQPGHLDGDICFRHLGGIATQNILTAAPIRPIFVMNTADSRIIADRDVAAGLEDGANLAAMPWEDFEHLVRQLFEWMFSAEGVEVKVTRASRDRGVDAIVFDPDPIRGGKYVIQAKRYTRTVDVAAVRDLYGTVVNEGANRGILVTTSSYGPDSYDFAKDKPLSLIDGPNLISLLRKHGRIYRIDLEQARSLTALD